MTGIIEQVRLWQRGETSLDELTHAFVGLDEPGGEVGAAITELCGDVGRTGNAQEGDWNSAEWRAALLGCRARTWPTPGPAGLLAGSGLLILTDGQQGVVLREGNQRCLPRAICPSLLLLAQTIVMADDALDAREVDTLRQQRTQATSTSLSEIDPIR
ncbi:hypothetical protein [Deinococcus hopiensis]|uniref:Uncharacterized protein n=1 Tax=Deinococcus hopiensis KR-140 TaxID=695939 RepID=A0A1W1UGT1_9DEIO|nr:hypothetical protein [Deinococcus hopiensis]SMB80232.1 hypothetical protein SAMN00790413_05453 [Deinococcus hopiensis KR-140]